MPIHTLHEEGMCKWILCFDVDSYGNVTNETLLSLVSINQDSVITSFGQQLLFCYQPAHSVLYAVVIAVNVKSGCTCYLVQALCNQSFAVSGAPVAC